MITDSSAKVTSGTTATSSRIPTRTTAIGVFASSLSRSQVIGFVIALAVSFTMLIIGFDPVINAVANWGVPASVVNAVASCSLMRHFDALCRGVVDLADVGYYAGVIVFMLAAAQVVTVLG